MDCRAVFTVSRRRAEDVRNDGVVRLPFSFLGGLHQGKCCLSFRRKPESGGVLTNAQISVYLAADAANWIPDQVRDDEEFGVGSAQSKKYLQKILIALLRRYPTCSGNLVRQVFGAVNCFGGYKLSDPKDFGLLDHPVKPGDDEGN